MNTNPGTMVQNDDLSVSQVSAAVRVPPWEQLPVEKQQELTRILAEMLLKQAQAEAVKHEQPS